MPGPATGTDFGDDCQKTQKDFIDFLLLDSKDPPLVVFEAKADDKATLLACMHKNAEARCKYVG